MHRAQLFTLSQAPDMKGNWSVCLPHFPDVIKLPGTDFLPQQAAVSTVKWRTPTFRPGMSPNCFPVITDSLALGRFREKAKLGQWVPVWDVSTLQNWVMTSAPRDHPSSWSFQAQAYTWRLQDWKCDVKNKSSVQRCGSFEVIMLQFSQSKTKLIGLLSFPGLFRK